MGKKGFTLIEVLVVLGILSLLITILLPQIMGNMDIAAKTRGQADCQNIATAINQFRFTTGSYPLFTTGADIGKETKANVVTLRGEGEIPTESVTTAWTSEAPSDSDIVGAGPTYDYLLDHLIMNIPDYRETGLNAWKGPYILRLPPDPWGNAYLVNAANLISASKDAAFCLSAGPNGDIETEFNIDYTDPADQDLPLPSGDDVIYRIK